MSGGGGRAAAPGTLDAGVSRSFAALGFGETAARLIAFGASVLLARRLGPGPFGVLALASALLLYFQYLTDFGVDTVGVPRVARDRGEVERAGTSVLMARALVGAGLWAVLAVAGLWLLPQPEGALLAALGVLLIPRGLNPRWILVGLDRSGPVALARTVGELLTALVVVLALHAPGDLGLAPAAYFAGDALAALLMAVALRRMGFTLRARWDAAAVRPVFREARPLVAHAMLALLIFNFDLIALRFFVDTAAVGLYATAYALVAFLTNLGVSYGYSLLPAFARATPVDGAAAGDDLTATALAHAVAFTLPLAVGGALLATQLMTFVYGAGYGAAGLALGVLVWTVPAAWVRTVGQMLLVARGRQHDVLRITLISAALTVALDLLLIPRYGLAGAAAATLVAESARAALALGYARRAGAQLPGAGRLVPPLVGVAVMAGVVLWAPGHVLLVVGAGAASYALVLVATGAVRLGPGRRLAVRL